MGATDGLIRVAALTSGKNEPSARFRIRQYLPDLRLQGIDVADYCPPIGQGVRIPGALGRIRERYLPPVVAARMILNLVGRIPGIFGSFQADLTWLGRNFIPGLDDLAGLLKPPVVLDIDDAIWLYNPLGRRMIGRLVGRADMVLAGNQFIADWCSAHCKTIATVATGIDCNRFSPPLEPKSAAGPFVVGWTGTSGNFPFLKMIEPALAKFLRLHPDARFRVVADRRPRLTSLPPNQFLFEQWQAKTEHAVLHQMDIGIMPLDDSDLSRGKCSFKMLQYMASGLPVIASPYGMNREILDLIPGAMGPKTLVEWFDCLQTSKQDTDLRSALAAAGRDIAVSNFATEKISLKIASAFHWIVRASKVQVEGLASALGTPRDGSL